MPNSNFHIIIPTLNNPHFFFFNDTATTEIYTLSLHDALPICSPEVAWSSRPTPVAPSPRPAPDRKSTRLNSSHEWISYAVFCLKKKKTVWGGVRVDVFITGDRRRTARGEAR